jgi:hypothetical protein
MRVRRRLQSCQMRRPPMKPPRYTRSLKIRCRHSETNACVRLRYYSRRVELARASACPYTSLPPGNTATTNDQDALIPERPRTLDEAKAQLTKAEAATTDAEAALRESGDSNPELSKAVSYVRYCRDFLRDDAAAKTRGQDSMCGLDPDTGNTRRTCFAYGVMSASLSYVFTPGSTGHGSNQLLSVASPFAAVRWLPSPLHAPAFGIDIVGAYSSFLTSTAIQRLNPQVTKMPCSSSGSPFDAKLSCQANANEIPYGALYFAGLTVGKKGLSYVQLVPLSIGIGQLGSEQSLRPFLGAMLNVLQISGEF